MLQTILVEAFTDAFQKSYNRNPDLQYVNFQKTRPEFEGDFTIVIFPFSKDLKMNPEVMGQVIGEKMVLNHPLIVGFNVVKGFLNLHINQIYWFQFIEQVIEKEDFGSNQLNIGKHIVVEYSSPNTNKPLHLGHIRNNLLGWSVAEILKANGYQVTKVNLVNDRGIHICKSMLAWQKWSNQSPKEAGLKGDKLVGEMYVRFDKALKEQTAALVAEGESPEQAAKNAPLMLEAQHMLRLWEGGDEETIALWKKMNDWVYDGFDITYRRLGVGFDQFFYESDTYLLGKSIVMEGLSKGVLFQKEDKSIWCDLTADGLDEKLLLRSDGTSVYMTQDLGTAEQRHNIYKPEKMIYVVGNEQNYHFDVLKLILKKLGRDWANGIEHLSYGMVELPQGKMKSREGTVVDADDLMDEMIQTARQKTEELGKASQLSEQAANELYHQIGLGALKYFMLKVDPKKTMLFNPADSIDFNGNTGPFIQYTHARIRSIIRKAEESDIDFLSENQVIELNQHEKHLIKLIHHYPSVVVQAGEQLSPALIANFIFELAKEFNHFYQTINILKENNLHNRSLRIKLCLLVAKTLKHAGGLIGLVMPEKM